MTHSPVLYQSPNQWYAVCVCEIPSASISSTPPQWPLAQYGIYEANQWEGKQ